MRPLNFTVRRLNMRRATPVKILMADFMGDDRSFLLVYLADDGHSYELYLPAAGQPLEPIEYMSPSMRQQQSGNRTPLSWPEAEDLARELRPLLTEPIAKGGRVRASECIEALANGKRYGLNA